MRFTILASSLVPLAFAGIAAADRLPQFPNEQLPVTLRSVHDGKCLDIRNAGGDGAQLQQFTCGEQENQTWFLSWTGGSDYQLRPGHLGNVRLGIAGESTGDGAVALLINGDAASQRFQFVRQPDGSYAITNTRSGKCLDIPGASTADGVTIQQYACHGGTNQRWKIVPRERPLNLVSKESGRCLDVAGASQADGARVQVYDCLGTQQTNQGWIMEAGVKGFYRLRAAHSNKCLAATGAFASPMIQTKCSTASAQQWRFTADPDGYVEIQNKDYTCVDTNHGLVNGKPVVGTSCWGGPNQRFVWRRSVRRHLLVVQPATSAGFDRYVANPADITQALAVFNATYKPNGVELLFDPAVDMLDLESDGLHNVGVSSTWTTQYACDDPTVFATPVGCANEIARLYPDHVVIVIGPGAVAGFSNGFDGFVFLRPELSPNACGTGVASTLLAHEVGHYFGLGHTFGAFPDAAAAGAAWIARGEAAFDGDLLEDTAPDPYMNNSCVAPTQPSTYVWLTVPPTPPFYITQVAISVPTDNALSYYFNIAPQITPQQAAIVRATAYMRGL
ncbi:MAG: RICIN domain-containing protein [Kofleriaceae bacterium]